MVNKMFKLGELIIPREEVLRYLGHKSSQKIDDNISVREAVNNYIGAGFDVMTSIKKVAKDRGLAKNVIYSEYHREDK